MDKATAGQRYKEAVWAVMLEVYESGEFHERTGAGIKPLEMLSAFREAGGTEEELLVLWRDLNNRELEPGLTLGAWVEQGEVHTEWQGKRVSYENEIDEVFRLPATDFTGPKDPRLDVVINYIRQNLARLALVGGKAKPSQFADPDVLKMEGREISKPKTFRRL
jgi:hypothetical protein